MRLPYNYKSIFDLWVKGYYLEACIIQRHVLEGFAQLRYFHNHRNLIKDHTLAKSQKNRVRFITMSEEIAPGSYKKLYGDVLSHYAHGGLGTLFFRAEYTSPTQGTIELRLKFNQTSASYVMNQTVGFGYGHLNYADVFFPNLLPNLSKDIAEKMAMFIQEYKTELHQPKPTPEMQDHFDNVVAPFIEK